MPTGPRFLIAPQPDGSSCGPTCLQAVYRWYGEPLSVPEIIKGVPQLDGGGTLGVELACHALRRGYDVELYSFNLLMWDPSWFTREVDLAAKLIAQKAAKRDVKLQIATDAYLTYLRLKGRVDMCDPSPSFVEHLLQGGPVIVGLSSTWLYGGPRERGTTEMIDDDIAGIPQGHFVVVCGCHPETNEVVIADPYRPNPFSEDPIYSVDAEHFIASLLLGIVTYDANLIAIRPRRGAP